MCLTGSQYVHGVAGRSKNNERYSRLVKSRKILFIVLGCVGGIFLAQQLCMFIVTGESLIAVRNIQVNMPRAYADIGEICVAMNSIASELKGEPSWNWLTDCERLAGDEFVPWLSLHQSQPLSEFGICQLYSAKTDEAYLYGHNDEYIRGAFEGDEGEILSYIAVTTTAVRENPKGVYHAYEIRPGEEKWVIDWSGYPRLVESPVPPIPGCVYSCSEEEEAVYFPEKIIPALKAYYPNVKVPEELIMRTRLQDTYKPYSKDSRR